MIKEINVLELTELKKQKAYFRLIDVREAFEKEIADIGGELFPLGTLRTNTPSLDPKQKIVVYCRSGGRSAKAVEYLQEATQHPEIYNLAGGILAWIEQVDPSLKKY